MKPGTTCLGVEYFCFEDDEIWEMSDEEAVPRDGRARPHRPREPADVIDGVKVRVPKAYPIYDPTTRARFPSSAGTSPASRT